MKLAEETSDHMEQLKLDSFDMLFKLYEDDKFTLEMAKHILGRYERETDDLTQKIANLALEINSGEEA